MAAQKPPLGTAPIDWVGHAARHVEDLARVKRRQDELDQLRVEPQQTSAGKQNDQNSPARPTREQSKFERPLLSAHKNLVIMPR